MRIWDIDPGFLNDLSLLGEHRELHGLFSIHVNQKKGYSRHPETLRWAGCLGALACRHAILVREMTLRGFNHKSPLTDSVAEPPGLHPSRPGTDWPEVFIDPPHTQYTLLTEKYRGKSQGRITLPASPMALWAAHKYSVMARDPALYRRIGPEVAQGHLPFDVLSRMMVETLRKRPGKGRLVNALDHMWGYVSGHSRLKRADLAPDDLLKEIGTLAVEHNIAYLTGSTALGELGAWINTETGIKNNSSASAQRDGD